MWSFVVVPFLVVMCECFCDDPEVDRGADHDAKLRFYHGSLDNYTELPIRNAEKIFESNWNDIKRDTVIYTHGYLGRPEGNAVVSVIRAYLDQNVSNVALLNWEHLAANVRPSLANSYINWAAPNARKLGGRFADVLQTLQAQGLDLQKTHLVGHSLGAQLFGIAGNTLMARGVQIPWITGLDPASRDFENRPLPVKLHAGSATFVDIVHSDPSRLGYRRPMGTVDFWPNYKPGQVNQPGCNAPSTAFSLDVICLGHPGWTYGTDRLHPYWPGRYFMRQTSPRPKAGFGMLMVSDLGIDLKWHASDFGYWQSSVQLQLGGANYRKQKNCGTKLTDICSHNRSWELFVDSIKYPNAIIGSYAKNYRMWKNYSEINRHAVTLALGERKSNILPGNYFFTTTSKSPFGLGEKGL